MDLRELNKTQHQHVKRHPWELCRYRILNFFLNRCNDNQIIVDIGSGDAYLASQIAKRHPQSSVTAVDINYTPELMAGLTQQLPSNLVLTPSLETVASQKKIDVIILMDVLEHLEYPQELLIQILQLQGVSVKTNFIITVPAYQQLFSEHDRQLGHFKRYTRKQLDHLLKPLAIKKNKDGYCFNFLLMIRFFQVQKEKIFKRKNHVKTGVHNWKGNHFITGIITQLLWMEFKITWYLARIGVKLPGLSCYALCQPFQ